MVLFAGSLKFLTKSSDGGETLVWLRNGTQGNKWRFADLSFNNEQPIQVMIVAIFFFFALHITMNCLQCESFIIQLAQEAVKLLHSCGKCLKMSNANLVITIYIDMFVTFTLISFFVFFATVSVCVFD